MGADIRKYYYMRLKENFFDSDEMVILESLPQGYLYSNILLKLYLKSLKNNGCLMFNECIPYDAQMISTLLKQPIGIIRDALNTFQTLGLIDVLDNGTIYMSNIELFIGQSSNEAERKKARRMELLEHNGQMSDKRPTEIEIDIEKDIDIDIEKEKDIDTNKKKESTHPQKEPKHKYGEYQHVLLTDTDRERLVNDYGEEETHEAIKYLDEYIETSGKKYKNHYLVMRKWVFDAVKEHKNKPKTGDSLLDAMKDW